MAPIHLIRLLKRCRNAQPVREGAASESLLVMRASELPLATNITSKCPLIITTSVTHSMLGCIKTVLSIPTEP